MALDEADEARVAECQTEITALKASLAEATTKLSLLESKSPEDPKIPALEASLEAMKQSLQESRDQMAALVKRLKPKKGEVVPPEPKTNPSPAPRKKTALGHDWL